MSASQVGIQRLLSCLLELTSKETRQLSWQVFFLKWQKGLRASQATEIAWTYNPRSKAKTSSEGMHVSQLGNEEDISEQ